MVPHVWHKGSLARRAMPSRDMVRMCVYGGSDSNTYPEPTPSRRECAHAACMVFLQPLASHHTLPTLHVPCWGVSPAAPSAVLSAGGAPKSASAPAHRRAPWCTRYTR